MKLNKELLVEACNANITYPERALMYTIEYLYCLE